jgi:hypothetical protein
MSEVDKELLYWHNVQRTEPERLIPALRQEMDSVEEIDGKYSYMPYHMQSAPVEVSEGAPCWQEAI